MLFEHHESNQGQTFPLIDALISVLLFFAFALPVLATPLHEAAKSGEVSELRQRIGAGDDLNAEDSNGMTPLLWATLQRHTEIATSLIQAGAEINRFHMIGAQIVNERGAKLDPDSEVSTSPLLLAVFANDRSMVELLLAAGAEVNGTSEHGMTALIMAALEGRSVIVEILLQYNADTEVTFAENNTPLLLALLNNHIGLAKQLIEHGAKVNVRNLREMTPLRIAIELPNTELAEFLISKGARFSGDEVAEMRSSIAVHGSLPSKPGRNGSISATPLQLDRADIRGLAIDPINQRIYWTRFEDGSLWFSTLEGKGPTKLISSLNGPIGVALDFENDHLYWSTDRDYPRTLQRSNTQDLDIQTLLSGRFLNRPSAIAISSQGSKIYWTESVSGRIRRASLDGSEVEDLILSGHGEVDESDAMPFESWGLAVDEDTSHLYWSESVSAKIQRSKIDGSEQVDIITADEGLVFPAAIAIDDQRSKIYWSDLATEEIRRANLDGSKIETLHSSSRMAMDVRAMAIDSDRANLYWSNSSTASIYRSSLDGHQIEVIYDAHSSSPAVPGKPCLVSSRHFLRDAIKRASTCLIKAAAIRAVKSHADEAVLAVDTCTTQFRAVARQELPEEIWQAPPSPCLGEVSSHDASLGTLLSTCQKQKLRATPLHGEVASHESSEASLGKWW